MTDEESRVEFEKWINSPPHKRNTERYPETNVEWDGQYVDIAVQMAWLAWCERGKE